MASVEWLFHPLVSRSNWNLGMLVFVGGENRTWSKDMAARPKTNNKPNPHMVSTVGIEHEPRWWETSALTTAPFLLPICVVGILLPISAINKGLGLGIFPSCYEWAPLLFWQKNKPLAPLIFLYFPHQLQKLAAALYLDNNNTLSFIILL